MSRTGATSVRAGRLLSTPMACAASARQSLPGDARPHGQAAAPAPAGHTQEPGTPTSLRGWRHCFRSSERRADAYRADLGCLGRRRAHTDPACCRCRRHTTRTARHGDEQSSAQCDRHSGPAPARGLRTQTDSSGRQHWLGRAMVAGHATGNCTKPSARPEEVRNHCRHTPSSK